LKGVKEMIDNKVEEIKKRVEEIMDILGIEKTASNENTPLRVAKMYCNELFKNRNGANLEELNSRMKVFPNEGVTTPITVSDIEFSSTCEHHWLPFMGSVSVTYVPNMSIVGLSKIPRVVKYFSQRPQLQERLTQDIGVYLVKLLQPKSLTVVVNATHACVMCRGAESKCNTTTYYEYRGDDFETETN